MRKNGKIILASLIICGLSIGLIKITYSMHEVFAHNENNISRNITIEAAKKYPVNENGQTYGIDNDTGKSPDLIAAIGENEINGYVKSRDLLGEGDFINTLDEALEYDKKRAVLESQGAYREIPLYKSDGKTIIGEFRIYYWELAKGVVKLIRYK